MDDLDKDLERAQKYINRASERSERLAGMFPGMFRPPPDQVPKVDIEIEGEQ